MLQDAADPTLVSLFQLGDFDFELKYKGIDSFLIKTDILDPERFYMVAGTKVYTIEAPAGHLLNEPKKFYGTQGLGSAILGDNFSHVIKLVGDLNTPEVLKTGIVDDKLKEF